MYPWSGTHMLAPTAKKKMNKSSVLVGVSSGVLASQLGIGDAALLAERLFSKWPHLGAIGRSIFVLFLVSILGETISESRHWVSTQDQGEKKCGWGEWIWEIPLPGGERSGEGELSDRDEAKAQRGRNKGKDGEKELQEQKGKAVGSSGR